MEKSIDADELKDIVEYACDEDGSEEALKWCNWFKEVINAEYNRQQKKVKPIEASPQLSVEDSKKIIKEVYTKPHYKRGQRKREEMNSPCVNCCADLRVCKECDWYNGVWISKDQYEDRLKADMVAMLEDLDLQIDESAAYNLEVAKVQRLIRDRINALKEDKGMADIELVIKISEEMHAQIIDKNGIDTMLIPYKDIIKNGTPLPKGHGKLIVEPTEEDIAKTVGGQNDFAECIRDSVKAVFDNADAIIEADKAESEDKE